MKIEIWSDVMCPFCYIGKRNIEEALKNIEHSDQLEIEWKSFQLDESIPEVVEQSYIDYVSKKIGFDAERTEKMMENVVKTAKDAGLDFHFDKTIMTNSRKAHQLIQLAKKKGLGDAMEESLFKAYFTDGLNVSDEKVLVDLAVGVGLEATEAQQSLTSEKFSKLVDFDIAEARQIGVTGVPFFVLDRKYGISGAQPPAAFQEAITKALSEWQTEQASPIVSVHQDGATCTPESGSC